MNKNVNDTARAAEGNVILYVVIFLSKSIVNTDADVASIVNTLVTLIVAAVTASSKHPLILNGLFSIPIVEVKFNTLVALSDISIVGELVEVFAMLTCPPSLMIENGLVRNESLCKCIPDFCACALLGSTYM